MEHPQEPSPTAGATGPNKEPRRSIREEFLSVRMAVLLLVAILVLFSRFFHKDAYGLFEDDFFYYAGAAQHFAHSGRSTFDGIHLTNGYHPLWFVLLSVLQLFFAGTGFLVSVQVLSLVAFVAFYLALVNVFTYFGFRRTAAGSSALLVALYSLLLFRYGMEVTVSLPLGMMTLAWITRPAFAWTSRQTAIYGLLASLTVLGRLDSILLFGPLFLLQLLVDRPQRDVLLKRVAWYAIGFSPFFLYLGINLGVFGMMLPVSAAAKQTKPFWPLSTTPLFGMFWRFDRLKGSFVYPGALLLIAGIAATPWLLHRTRRTIRDAILLALLIFPFLQVGTLMVLTDWGTWPWYYYPLIYSSLASLILLLRREWKPWSPSAVLIKLVTVAYIVYMVTYAFKRGPSTIALLARDITPFMRSHPAIYGMGDEAGTTSYLSGQPIIQLEGLMMDKEFLQKVREQRPLRDVLHDYGVRYYVVLYSQLRNGCYDLHEPGNAGDRSPHIRGRVCAQPLFTSTADDGSTIRIFDASSIE